MDLILLYRNVSKQQMIDMKLMDTIASSPKQPQESELSHLVRDFSPAIESAQTLRQRTCLPKGREKEFMFYFSQEGDLMCCTNDYPRDRKCGVKRLEVVR